MQSIQQIAAGTYNEDCRKAFRSIPAPNDNLEVWIEEMAVDNGWNWLSIKYYVSAFAGLSESDQHKWAGYLVEIHKAMSKVPGKLVAVEPIIDVDETGSKHAK